MADASDIQRVVALLNQARGQAQLASLVNSEQLGQAAQAFASDPDGGDIFARVAATGYRSRTAAMAVDMGDTPEALVTSALAGETGAHIKNPDHSDVGIGRADSTWTMIFAAPIVSSENGTVTTAITSVMLGLVNGERQKVGAAPLALSEALNQAAQAHSVDMARRGFFDHQSPDGEDVDARARRAGFSGSMIGENIADGQGSSEEAMASWMTSPGHRENILKPEYTHLGVGVSEAKWTQVFGTLP